MHIRRMHHTMKHECECDKADVDEIDSSGAVIKKKKRKNEDYTMPGEEGIQCCHGGWANGRE